MVPPKIMFLPNCIFFQYCDSYFFVLNLGSTKFCYSVYIVSTCDKPTGLTRPTNRSKTLDLTKTNVLLKLGSAKFCDSVYIVSTCDKPRGLTRPTTNPLNTTTDFKILRP